MCTVSVIATPRGNRLVCNRDEQRSRPASTGLVRKDAGGHAAGMPIDPPSGGTWIGAADTGLVACLLNANPGVSRTHAGMWAGRRSRGVIVPHLLNANDLREALRMLADIDPLQYPPFRILLMSGDWHAISTSDGRTLHCGPVIRVAAPILLTSSGLGDDVATPPRVVLFRELIRSSRDLRAAQDVFHAHVWPGRPHISVHMSRPDARTVSRTAVSVENGEIMLQHDRFPESSGAASRSTLTLATSTIGIAA